MDSKLGNLVLNYSPNFINLGAIVLMGEAVSHSSDFPPGDISVLRLAIYPVDATDVQLYPLFG